MNKVLVRAAGRLSALFACYAMIVQPVYAQSGPSSGRPAAASVGGTDYLDISQGGGNLRAATINQILAPTAQRATLQRIVDRADATSISGNPVSAAADATATITEAAGTGTLTNFTPYYISTGVYSTALRVTGGAPVCGLYTDGTTNFCRFITASTPGNDNIAGASVAPFAVTGRAVAMNVGFHTDAPKVTFRLVGSANGSWRCFADNVPLQTKTPTAMGGNNTRSLTVQFGDGTETNRKWRDISCDFAGPVGLVGVAVDVLSTVYAPSDQGQVYAFALGDSYTAGSFGTAPNTNYSMMGWPIQAGKLLGWQVQASGIGGTGYTNPGTSQYTCGQRIGDLDQRAAWDVIVNACIYNDASQTPATVAAAAQAVWTAERAKQPKALIIVLGDYTPPGGTLSTLQAIEDAEIAQFNSWVAAGEKNAIFIPVARAAPRWQTGSGSTAATAGDGNSDIYIAGADASKVHPNDAGYENIARRFAVGVRNGLGSLLKSTIGPIQ